MFNKKLKVTKVLLWGALSYVLFVVILIVLGI